MKALGLKRFSTQLEQLAKCKVNLLFAKKLHLISIRKLFSPWSILLYWERTKPNGSSKNIIAKIPIKKSNNKCGENKIRTVRNNKTAIKKNTTTTTHYPVHTKRETVLHTDNTPNKYRQQTANTRTKLFRAHHSHIIQVQERGNKLHTH